MKLFRSLAVISIVAVLVLSFIHIQNKLALERMISVDIHADFLYMHSYLVQSATTDWDDTRAIEDRIHSTGHKISMAAHVVADSTYTLKEQRALLHDLQQMLQHDVFQQRTPEHWRQLHDLLSQLGLTHEQAGELSTDEAIAQLEQLVRVVRALN